MGKINWGYIADLAGDFPLDGEDTQEPAQDAAIDDLSSAPIDQLPSTPPTDKDDADLALRPGETLADRHGRLVLKAMAVNDEILSLPIDPDNPRVLSTISSTAQHIMNQQIKIDETRLKTRSDNRLADILARLEVARRQIDEQCKANTIDVIGTEVPCAEPDANDTAPRQIAPPAHVPARANTHHEATYRSYGPIGYDDMPHMRTKR